MRALFFSCKKYRDILYVECVIIIIIIIIIIIVIVSVINIKAFRLYVNKAVWPSGLEIRGSRVQVPH